MRERAELLLIDPIKPRLTREKSWQTRMYGVQISFRSVGSPSLLGLDQDVLWTGPFFFVLVSFKRTFPTLSIESESCDGSFLDLYWLEGCFTSGFTLSLVAAREAVTVVYYYWLPLAPYTNHHCQHGIIADHPCVGSPVLRNRTARINAGSGFSEMHGHA